MSETTSTITTSASNDVGSSVPEVHRASNGSAGGQSPNTAEADVLPLLTDYLDDVAARMELRLGDVAGVGITLKVDGAPFTAGASSTLAREVDLIQYRIGRGPCLDALQHGVGHYVPDLAADGRWGSYGPSAAARGAASCLSVPVLVNEQPAAVLKVYSAQRDGLTADQQARASESAPEIAGGVALARHLSRQAQLLDDRVAAMTTRRVIDMAIGILMQRLDSDPDTAFTLLRSISQTRNVKLRDVAQDLVASLPGSGPKAFDAPFKARGQRPARGR
ncbi:GAF and ANTAR domain-containing protein [Nakamurella sp. GG22]